MIHPIFSMRNGSHINKEEHLSLSLPLLSIIYATQYHHKSINIDNYQIRRKKPPPVNTVVVWDYIQCNSTHTHKIILRSRATDTPRTHSPTRR
mmetsp:Transcript_4984/g.5755  ORF Transcript_4984/g.5755 Transcript_4984/m.5755 type:complete len:93 (+) Transcript_4984:1062-1340(+)